jgi:hypothetical protein
MRKRTDDQASRLSSVDARMDAQKNAQQRSAGELHEMMTRITSVMRGDLGDQIASLRDEVVPKLGDVVILAREAKRLAESAAIAAATAGGGISSGGGGGGGGSSGFGGMGMHGNVGAQATTFNHMQTALSRASVNAEEALRVARDVSSKIGALDAGMAARVVKANETSVARCNVLDAHISALTKRVDMLSSEIAVSRESSERHNPGLGTRATRRHGGYGMTDTAGDGIGLGLI